MRKRLTVKFNDVVYVIFFVPKNMHGHNFFSVDGFWRGFFCSTAYRLAQCPREESKNGRPHLCVENRENVDFRLSLDSRFLPVAPQALIVEKNVLYLKCRQYIGLKLCRQKFFDPRFGSSARVDFRQTRLFCKNGFLLFLLLKRGVSSKKVGTRGFLGTQKPLVISVLRFGCILAFCGLFLSGKGWTRRTSLT